MSTPDMKVAVLILAHKNREQLTALINHLKPDFHVYVHIDKLTKWTIPNEQRVTVLDKRYAAYWGASTVPLAILELYKEAYKDNCDYYILISGQDIPLMSNKDILAHISKNYTDCIQYTKLPKPNWAYEGGIDRVALFWETKYESNNKGLKYLLTLPYKGSFWMLRQLQRFTGLRRNIPFPLWGGEMWSNLTKEAVTYIFSFLEKNEWYYKQFKFTRLSDEIFFQTLLLSFDYPGKDRIVNDDLRYIDWTVGPPYPKVFTMEDYEKCIASGKFFGRKFDIQIDAEVIDKLLAATSV